MDLFGITPEECVAFGDQYNDVEMLETVGMGYAMSNAAPRHRRTCKVYYRLCRRSS